MVNRFKIKKFPKRSWKCQLDKKLNLSLSIRYFTKKWWLVRKFQIDGRFILLKCVSTKKRAACKAIKRLRVRLITTTNKNRLRQRGPRPPLPTVWRRLLIRLHSRLDEK